ncbi:hypothetical protein D3C77_477400 [compost metagenome]
MREIVVTFITSIGSNNGFAFDGGTVNHSSQRPSLVAQPSWLNNGINVKSVAQVIGCVQMQKVISFRVRLTLKIGVRVRRVRCDMQIRTVNGK